MINCTITSPKKTTVYENVQSVTLPSLSGQMQVLPGHAESFALLQSGDIYIRQSNKKNKIVQNIDTDGECHIKDDKVVIIL